ncbi:MAG: methyltransferase TrmH [Rhodospirillales bacterium]|jgi:TrmH RNA methyltransferase|nr:methyltransferase TrmH [Rhodospirillales bacterium]MDB5382692.1 methyltransferase TrmH [Rhodospirillales bacterium]
MKPHDPDRICGVSAVTATFRSRPAAVLRLFYTAQRKPEAGPLCAILARAKKPYREVPAAELERIAGTPHHGGLVAVVHPRPIPLLNNLPFPKILFEAPVLPILDGIGNPHNLGAIARTAAFLGCKAMLLSADPRQATIADSAWRTSEGALESLEVFRVPDLPGLLRALSVHMPTLAATLSGGVPPGEVGGKRPVALVLGNEEHGIPAATLAACTGQVTLKGSGSVESLNVSTAAAILIHSLAG